MCIRCDSFLADTEEELQDEEELDLEEGLFDDPNLMITEHMETPVAPSAPPWNM